MVLDVVRQVDGLIGIPLLINRAEGGVEEDPVTREFDPDILCRCGKVHIGCVKLAVVVTKESIEVDGGV